MIGITERGDTACACLAEKYELLSNRSHVSTTVYTVTGNNQRRIVMKKIDLFKAALITAADKGLTTEELATACKTSKQGVHSCAYSLKKQKIPGFKRIGYRYYLINKEVMIKKLNLDQPFTSYGENLLNRVSSLENKEDISDFLELAKKSLYYHGSAMALLNASEAVAKIRNKVL